MRLATHAVVPSFLLGLALTLALAACGSDSAAPPTVVPTPAPTPAPTSAPPTLISEGTTAINGRQVVNFNIETTKPGTVEVTVDYLYADSQILVWLTDRQCRPEWFENDACDYLVKSLDGPKPRVMSASNVAAGTYSVFIANDGPHDPEQATWKVTLASTSSSARLAASQPVLAPRP